MRRINRGERVISLRRYLLAGWAVASGLMLAVFVLYGVYSILRTTEELTGSNQIVANHYAQRLNKDIESMKSYVDRIYSENVQFQILKRPFLSEPEWYSSTYYLTNNLEGRAGILNYFGGVFFYDASKETLRSQYSEFDHRGDNYRLNLCLKSYLNRIGDEAYHEGYFRYEEETYLVYMKGIRQKLVGFVLNLNSYFPAEEDFALVFYNGGEILETVGKGLTGQEAAKLLALGTDRGAARGVGYVVATDSISFLEMRLAVIQETGSIPELMGSWEFWLLFILIPLILIIVLLAVLHLFNHALVWPVEHLARRLDKMKEDGQAEDEAEGVKALELLKINRRLDEIVSEMQHMQQEKYMKEMEANAAKLQYYQLQVNPHFFINCLNLMDSLLSEKNVDTVRLMIRWLSEHFRYVFRNQESLVTIREELKEVEAYCQIYMVRGEMPILVQKDVKEELMDCCVPILAIQTFVENSVKHARRKGQILAVEVAVEEVERKDGMYISVRVSDNGEGYPGDKLEEFNAPVTEFCYHSRHIGIDNIKYRIYLMYGSQARFFFYNAPAGGAVAELLLPKREEAGSL
ncbi:MAG: histidine kinase [Roseburia sp.]|nr:histidine kinase [Roseburia sp.]MCM1096797.1 histidine kinase [Ruminococcus flavefaciens]